MNALLLLALLLCVSVMLTAGFGGGSGAPGGWSVIDPRDEDVQRIANFAVVTKYPEHKPQFLVVLAKKQVCAIRLYIFSCVLSIYSCLHDRYLGCCRPEL